MIQYIAISIDGPAASGKTTVGRIVARKLGIQFLDSGKLYRVAALLSETLTLKIPELLDHIDLKLKGEKFIANGLDVTKKLNTVEIGEKASVMSVDPKLREWVNKTIRKLAKESSIIVTGRDIGTVVLPDAGVKIYLDASVEERTIRRFKDEKGRKSYKEIFDALKKRDARDSGRKVAPLKQADGSTLIDSTNMTIPQVVNVILNLAKEKLSQTKLSRWWRFSYSVALWYSRMKFDIEIHGRGNIPTEGPVIVVANHVSLLDVFFVGFALPRMATYLAKIELMKIPLISNAVRAYGAVPVRREFATRDTIMAINKALSKNDIMTIFPEATRSWDGKLSGRYQTGAVQFAHKYHAKIVPIGIIGGHEIMAPGTKYPKKGKVTVNVGEPIELDFATACNKDYYEQAIKDVMAEVAKLSNQEPR